MNNSTVYYQLTGSLNCSSSFINPLGSTSMPFKGTLDGKGFVVSNIDIDTNTDNVGLFRYGMNCVIKNIIFNNLSVKSSKGTIGGITASCDFCVFDNVTIGTTLSSDTSLIQGTNSTSNANIGGFIGSSSNCNISNSILKNTVIDGGIIYTGVGGFIGLSTMDTITNSINYGFPSNSNKVVISGNSNIGGIVGDCRSGTKILNSGVSNGQIFSTNGNVGGISGSYTCLAISQAFVKETVTINATSSGSNIGGIIGLASLTAVDLTLSNVYSRGTIFSQGSTFGGMIGLISNSGFFSIQNSYSSTKIITSTVNEIGTIIGKVGLNNCTFLNVFYDSSVSYNPIGTSGSSGCSLNSNGAGLTCGNLYSKILTFNQSIWSGNNLLFESNYGICNCSGGCPTPSTLIPSTQIPSTTVPSTTPPSTTSPSTTSPSTTFPSTTSPSTTSPSTTSPSTTSPSTTNPSTNSPSTFISTQTDTPSTSSPSTTIPSTQTPSTTSPSTTTPSTNSPSTTTPSTMSPTTSIPSTQTPSTIIPSFCLYLVPNCDSCPSTGLLVNTSIFNVSCQFINPNWVYVIQNKTSGDINFDSNLEINGTTYFNGNLTISKNSTLIINVNDNSTSIKLNVTGCANIDGKIIVNLNSQPTNSDFKIEIVQYNCPNISIDPSQITFSPNFSKEKCQTSLNSINNQQNSLSVSFSFNRNKSCSRNIGLIVGLTVGIPLGLILVVVVLIVILRYYAKHKSGQFNQNNANNQNSSSRETNKYDTNKMNELNNI